MGLDMYLSGKYYLWHDSDREDIRKFLAKPVFKHRSRFDKSRKKVMPSALLTTNLVPEYIEFQVMYWRKANAIHRWFVQNIQDGKDDCGVYYVSCDNLTQLLTAIENALATPNPEKVLPTQPGFFFGGTEYDDYYIEELKRTKTELTRIVNDPQIQDMSLYYHSSW